MPEPRTRPHPPRLSPTLPDSPRLSPDSPRLSPILRLLLVLFEQPASPTLPDSPRLSPDSPRLSPIVPARLRGPQEVAEATLARWRPPGLFAGFAGLTFSFRIFAGLARSDAANKVKDRLQGKGGLRGCKVWEKGSRAWEFEGWRRASSLKTGAQPHMWDSE